MEEPDVLDHLRKALAPQYDVERVLGHGGMGMVVLGRDRALDRAVAIKVISPDIEVTPRHRQRFLQEARIVANLRHPNIVAVYTAGEADGLLYFVMEYVPGESLRDLLDRERCCDDARAQAILRDLAGALAFAHARGVVHRDIKPENVLLDHETGRAMLTDFGVAQALTASDEERLTRPGVVVGSPQYMSPEQASGVRELDGRSDIYALGLIGYEMLAGEPAFAGSSVVSVLTKQLTEPPPPLGPRAPGAAPSVVAAVMRALEKDPEDRWQDASEMARALAGELTAEPPTRLEPSVSAPSPAPAAPAERPTPTASAHPEQPPPRPFVGPGRPAPRTGRARRIATWLATATAVLLFAAPVAWVIWPRSAAPARATAASLVLVLPFEIQSADPLLAPLRGGSARMLTQDLAPRTDVKVVDYEQSLRLLRAAGLDTARTIELVDALRVGRSAGARTVVMGQVSRGVDYLAVVARMYDVASGALVGQVERKGAAGADPRGLFAALAPDIAGATRPPPPSRPAPGTSAVQHRGG